MGSSASADASAAKDAAAADRAAILDVARVPVAKKLGKTVLFNVTTLNREGDWAFLIADMKDANHSPVSYKGTPLAELERHGAVSKSYVALLRKQGKNWTLVEHAIGPTDVVWAEWPTKHQLPGSLVAIQ